MTGVLLRIAIPSALFALLIGGAFYAGVRWANDRAALDAARDHISTRERIDDALNSDRGCAWLDRLRGACE